MKTLSKAAKRTYRCLQPTYAARFRCDGTACDSTCCHGWNIQLDNAALDRFRKAPRKLRRKLFSHIARNKETGIQEIVKKGDFCPMLGKDLLCSLQKSYGEDFIADVCAEYPRLTTQFPGLLERALCMTCPVAARIALFDEAPMQFEEVEVTTARESYFQQANDEEAVAAIHFFDLQQGSIEILQDRSLLFPERLGRLDAFLRRAEELLAARRGDEIPEIPKASLPCGNRVPFSRRIPLVLSLLEHLVEKSEDEDPASREFALRIARILQQEESMAGNADALYASYEKRVLLEHGHIVEHYFVNEYFAAAYPCILPENFHHNVRVFMAIYCLLELFLISLLAEKDTLDEEDFLSAIRWLAIRVKHFVGYIPLISDFLKENEEPFLC